MRENEKLWLPISNKLQQLSPQLGLLVVVVFVVVLLVSQRIANGCWSPCLMAAGIAVGMLTAIAVTAMRNVRKTVEGTSATSGSVKLAKLERK